MTRQTINSLTGLRGIAAIWVALFHGTGMLAIDPGFPVAIRNVIQCGWVAVDLFFVLSGYVMCYVHLGDFEVLSWSSTWRYWKLRLARIYPAHAVMTLAWLPVMWMAAVVFPETLTASVKDQFSLSALAAALTLTNGWGLPHSQGWNGVSWSVGSEWFAYLSFPLLAFLLNGTLTMGKSLLLAAVAMAVPFGLAIVVNGGSQFMLPWSWTIVRVETAFVLGMAMYHLSQHIRPAVATMLTIASLLGIAFVTIRAAPGLEIGVLICCFALLISGAAKSRIADALFGSRVLTFLGTISYSIYLSHYLVVVFLRHIFQRLIRGTPTPTQSGILLIVFLAITVAVGYGLFTVIENPMRKILRRTWINRKDEVPLGSATSN